MSSYPKSKTQQKSLTPKAVLAVEAMAVIRIFPVEGRCAHPQDFVRCMQGEFICIQRFFAL